MRPKFSRFLFSINPRHHIQHQITIVAWYNTALSFYARKAGNKDLKKTCRCHPAPFASLHYC